MINPGGRKGTPVVTGCFNICNKSSIICASMSETINMNPAEVSTNEAKSGPLDITQIQAILPHRFPFLLIDRVLEIQRRKKLVALKNVTANEPFFAGHFPGFPIMPGVLVVESMAQAGGALLLMEIEDRNEKLMVFTGIERARFRRPVVPGDQLRIEVEVLAFRRNAGRMAGKAFVDGKLVCEATISCVLVDRARGQTNSGSSAGPEPTE
jgi:3-hydroxyacyl-[acyl-carrier-protein] dehydratase